ncbi:hypothetical protein LTR97_001122 [Elasticomyces elasticus]|uniref:DUF4440 domain-containing protein n=1 Tax=Elasticomyces elasticus TaxID=574655 RepID=A0AAN8A4X0_9PEZI|nr:hypothetical protein LTR97_001122 [Elasticomyces elasticus]
MPTENTTPTSTVKTFLAAIKAHDTDRMRAVCHPNATGCLIRDGKPIYTTVAAILQMLDERKDEAMEEISRDEVEHVCGEFANVWAPYKFFSGGKVHHEGGSAYTLWKSPEGGWVITVVQDIALPVGKSAGDLFDKKT